jgi:hypothetical protein
MALETLNEITTKKDSQESVSSIDLDFYKPRANSKKSDESNNQAGGDWLTKAEWGVKPGDGHLLSYGVISEVGSIAATTAWTSLGKYKLHQGLNNMALGFAIGTGAALVNRELDFLVGDSIGNVRAFRPTGIESLGYGIAAAVPLDYRWKIGLSAAAWTVGRVDNLVEHR